MVYELNLNYYFFKFVLSNVPEICTDKIVHGSRFKEAYSLLGEYKLTIAAQNIHTKKEAHRGCCLKKRGW